MPQRMLQLLGGLLAVAILAVGASVATGDPAPSGHAAGTGGGNGNGNDNYPPSSQWGNDWQGNDGNGRYWRGWGDGNGYFDGNSNDSNGSSNNRSGTAGRVTAAAPGKVDRVMVAVKRLRGSQCQHMNTSGRLGSPGSCAPTHWTQANGTTSWRYPISKRLPRGVYRLHQYAVDASGNRERRHALHVRIR